MKVYVVHFHHPEDWGGVVDVYATFEAAKQAIIDILRRNIEDRNDEIASCEEDVDDEDESWTAEVIADLKELNEGDEKAIRIISDSWTEENGAFHQYDFIRVFETEVKGEIK